MEDLNLNNETSAWFQILKLPVDPVYKVSNCQAG